MSYRKPTELKILHGTDQPCRRKASSPPAGDNLPKRIPPPEYLNPPGRKKWNELVRLLREQGILEKTDLGSLEACCVAYDEMVACQLAINEKGGIVAYTNGKSSQQVPLISVKNKAMDNYKKYMTEFGLSPASRAKLGIEKKPEKSDIQIFMEKMKKQA